MSNQELELRAEQNRKLAKLADYYCEKYFNSNCPCTVKFNYRMRSKGGRFLAYEYRDTGKLVESISINPKMIKVYGIDGMKQALRHELVHWYLFSQALPNNDNDLGFIHLAHKLHCMIHLDKDKPLSPVKYYYVYQCSHCFNTFLHKRRENTKHYVCAKCHGKLNCLGKVPVKDVHNPSKQDLLTRALQREKAYENNQKLMKQAKKTNKTAVQMSLF